MCSFVYLTNYQAVIYSVEVFCWINDNPGKCTCFLHQNTLISGRMNLWYGLGKRHFTLRITILFRIGQPMFTIWTPGEKEHVFYRPPPNSCPCILRSFTLPFLHHMRFICFLHSCGKFLILLFNFTLHYWNFGKPRWIISIPLKYISKLSVSTIYLNCFHWERQKIKLSFIPSLPEISLCRNNVYMQGLHYLHTDFGYRIFSNKTRV